METDVIGIFNRDQRTIKNRRDSRERQLQIESYNYYQFSDDDNNNNNININSRINCKFFPINNFGMVHKTCINRIKTNRKLINYHNFIKGLVKVCIFGVLLTVVRAPTVMSHPASPSEREGGGGGGGNTWINPCGREFSSSDSYSSGSVSSSESDRDLIRPILTTAGLTEYSMRRMKENYTKELFHIPKTHVLHWLPNRESEVPKSLGEKVDISHLESQRLDTFLQNIYQSMQKYAVGIEQVVEDQKNMSGKFLNEFVETQRGLKKVLCEIRSAMYNGNIKPPRNVETSIMDEQARKISDPAERNLRDWIIFKESLNGLEYLIQVLEYFEANSPS